MWPQNSLQAIRQTAQLVAEKHRACGGHHFGQIGCFSGAGDEGCAAGACQLRGQNQSSPEFPQIGAGAGVSTKCGGACIGLLSFNYIESPEFRWVTQMGYR